MSILTTLDQHEPAARIADGAAVSVLGAAVMGWLPHVATVLTIVWMAIRIANEVHKWRTRNDPKFFNRRKGD